MSVDHDRSITFDQLAAACAEHERDFRERSEEYDLEHWKGQTPEAVGLGVAAYLYSVLPVEIH